MKFDKKKLLEVVRKHTPDTISPDRVLLAEIEMVINCKRAVWRQLGYSEEEIDQLSVEYIERKLTYSYNKKDEAQA